MISVTFDPTDRDDIAEIRRMIGAAPANVSAPAVQAVAARAPEPRDKPPAHVSPAGRSADAAVPEGLRPVASTSAVPEGLAAPAAPAAPVDPASAAVVQFLSNGKETTTLTTSTDAKVSKGDYVKLADGSDTAHILATKRGLALAAFEDGRIEAVQANSLGDPAGGGEPTPAQAASPADGPAVPQQGLTAVNGAPAAPAATAPSDGVIDAAKAEALKATALTYMASQPTTEAGAEAKQAVSDLLTRVGAMSGFVSIPAARAAEFEKLLTGIVSEPSPAAPAVPGW